MISILIKSFNRPYYLDRCLNSIVEKVKGNYQITILDDGTPTVYIDKLKQKFPKVHFIFSANYVQKTELVANLDNYKEFGFEIPTKMWIDAVEKASDYFIITEDDVWFTQPIHLDKLVAECEANNVQLLKLGWNSNTIHEKYLSITKILENIETIKITNLFIPKFFFDSFYYNKNKLFSILYKLKLVNNETKKKYWLLNSILMGLWNKNYWLEVWKNSNGVVNEKLQIRNAAKYYRKNSSDSFLARLRNESMKTTFKSSVSGSYHKYNINLNINTVNKILNDAWLNGEFDAMENYPNDFSDGYIQHFLEKNNHPDAQFSEWQKWSEEFKKQYRNLGAQVD